MMLHGYWDWIPPGIGLLGLFVLFLLWLLIVFTLVRIVRNQPPREEKSLEILQSRYERGEIDREEFERMKKELGGEESGAGGS